MKRVFTPTKKNAILLLDDDQPVSQGFRDELQAQGFKVELTAAFDTAMQLLENPAVDLAILDLCLPGINGIELIKNIRSDCGRPIPIIAFSNPYLGTLTQAATEAGATKSVAKVETPPERLLEIMRELGVCANSNASSRSAVETLEGAKQEKLSSNPSINRPQVLAKLRASYQNFTRTERDDLRRAALLQMHRQLRLLAGSANLFTLGKIVQLSTALEALLVELYSEPAKITASVVRTIAHSIETLASLLDFPANSQDEVVSSSKILVVDDEVIARQLVCSAVGKAGLDAVGLDNPLAAQRLLKREAFDLIFLDVEMPRLTGLELCVKIRAMKANRNTPIVFVTSHSDFGSRAQSALSGGNDFIAKPFLLVEVALKTLTWLFRDRALPLPTARLRQRVATNASGRKPQLAARQAELELPHTLPVM